MMKSVVKRMVVGGLGSLLCASLLVGCGSEATDSKEVLKVGVTNFADTLEPTENYFAWVVMRYGVGESLTKFDKEMKVTPWLAESWKIGDDKLTWTFVINKDAKFSNGKPVTAQAVKDSIERTFVKSKRAKTFFPELQ